MLETLAAKNSEVKIRKVDINRPNVKGIDFQSPLAQQYQLAGVPTFMVFEPSGKVVTGEAAGDAVIQLCLKSGLTEDYLRKQLSR